MSIKAVQPVGTFTADTTFGPSAAIWAQCDWPNFRENPGLGHTSWMSGGSLGTQLMTSAYAGGIGAYTGYGYAGAQINDGQLEGGAARLSSDGDNEGLAIMESQAGKYRLVTTTTLAYNKRMWFEASVSLSSVATAHMDAFVGLMKPTLASGLPAAAQPITTTDNTLMTAGDLLGFQLGGTSAVRGGPTEVAFAFGLASGTVNYPTNMTTLMASSGNAVLAAATVVKLGFIFDPNAQTKQITKTTARQTAGNKRAAVLRIFVNGLEIPAFLTTEDVQNATAAQAFPTAFMTPVVAMMNMASQSSDYLTFNWIRAAQETNS